jgi:very-short-patch-repair endonuclease
LKTLLWIIVGLAILLVVLAVLKKRGIGSSAGHGEPWPFYAKRPLSAPEQVLYQRLLRALPDHIVLAQVQVSRVLGVKKGFNFHQWNNRINRLSYDFVVCAKDATVLATIELDDKSHEAARRLDTDGKKDKATAAAGIRMIRWNVRAIPDAAAIQAAVAPAAVAGDKAVQDQSSAAASRDAPSANA